jgi:hypothetical protein
MTIATCRGTSSAGMLGGRSPDGWAGGDGQLDGLTGLDDIWHRLWINFVARATGKRAEKWSAGQQS